MKIKQPVIRKAVRQPFVLLAVERKLGDVKARIFFCDTMGKANLEDKKRVG